MKITDRQAIKAIGVLQRRGWNISDDNAKACANCGHDGVLPSHKFCGNCGFSIPKRFSGECIAEMREAIEAAVNQ